MSRLLAAVVALAAAHWLVCRLRRAAATRDRLIRETHERADAAREIDPLELAYSLPAYDPAWDAGRERLWDAVRDNQHKGEL